VEVYLHSTMWHYHKYRNFTFAFTPRYWEENTVFLPWCNIFTLTLAWHTCITIHEYNNVLSSTYSHSTSEHTWTWGILPKHLLKNTWQNCVKCEYQQLSTQFWYDLIYTSHKITSTCTHVSDLTLKLGFVDSSHFSIRLHQPTSSFIHKHTALITLHD
jgi:hypothetical protein